VDNVVFYTWKTVDNLSEFVFCYLTRLTVFHMHHNGHIVEMVQVFLV